jgi:hypothetical protein
MSYNLHTQNNSSKANKAIGKLSKSSKGTLGTKLAGETFSQPVHGKGKKKHSVVTRPTSIGTVAPVSKLHPSSLNNESFKKVKQTLIKWINSILSKRKLQITDIVNDLSDGLLIACVLEELTGEHIVEWATTTSAKGKGTLQLNHNYRNELYDRHKLP